MYWNNLQDLQKVKDILNQDKIILSSGDTVLGLLGRLTQKSYQSLNHIKQRSDKPYLIMISSVARLPYFIDQPMNEKIEKLISLGWPGPLTIIFKARADLPDFIQSSDGTIALRVPRHAGLLALLESYDGLFSTSANVHTQSIPENINDVSPSIQREVAGICLDGTTDTEFLLLPSTILDCSSGKIKVVRAGRELDDNVKELID